MGRVGKRVCVKFAQKTNSLSPFLFTSQCTLSLNNKHFIHQPHHAQNDTNINASSTLWYSKPMAMKLVSFCDGPSQW